MRARYVAPLGGDHPAPPGIWSPGDQVMCRTAMGDEVIGTATSGIVMGRDMQVVWIDFGDRHLLPWPATAVRATERYDDEGA